MKISSKLGRSSSLKDIFTRLAPPRLKQGMLKFKTHDNVKNDLDLIEISTSKADENSQNDSITNNFGIVNTFITLFSDTEGLKSLKPFLITTNLWNLLLFPSDQEFPLIKSTIIHLYFSIPDRLSAAFKFETDEFFFPRNFQSFTENSLNQSLSNSSSNLKRFIFALERLEGFALHKLVKIPAFWDYLDFELISLLSNTSKQIFLASLLKNLLSLNFSFKRLSKIIKKISVNLHLEPDDLVNLFIELFIFKGLIDYKGVSLLISSFAAALEEANRFLVNLLSELLRIWSNDSWTLRTPFNSQLHYSSCLMIISSLISPDLFASNIEQSLMNGIQTRLDHSDSQIRLIAACVAEILNQMHPESENKLDFDLDPKNEIVSHLKECQKLTRILQDESSAAPIAPDAADTISLNIASSYCSDDSSDDDDDLKPISSLLKEEEPKNSKTPIPHFLPDCLKLLRSNEDAEVVEKVLQKLEDTFATSSSLSRQIHAISTFNTLLTLNDNFDIKNFDSLRHKTMETLLIDQIKIVGPELIDSIFKSNKLVLGQKMELLTLISSSTQQKHFRLNSQKSKGIDFLENLCLPLLSQSVRHFHHFKRNHVMFLEKFMWLQAIILNFSQNYLQFDILVEKYLDLIHLTLNTAQDPSSNLLVQIPIQKALLIGTSVVLSSWPSRFPVLQYYQRFQEIYTFLNEVANGPGFQEDEQLKSLGTSVALALQNLTDPQKLLQESTEQLSLDIKSVKITTNLS